MEETVKQSDIVLSITVSEAVLVLCREVAAAIKDTRSDVLFAECNAITADLARRMGSLIVGAGSRFVDASIIGGTPKNGSSPRFYASVRHASELEKLREFGLDVRHIGPEVGQASGIKMCYAAMIKGTAAVYTELLMTAGMLGLSEHLLEEFHNGQTDVFQRMEDWMPGLPAKSRRWVSEMQEIVATFPGLGLTPRIFQGVADM